MKKSFWILNVLIIAIVLCFMVTGCDKEAGDNTGDIQPLEGVSIEFVSADLKVENPYIKLKWTNSSKYAISLGNSGQFYKDNNGTWELIGPAINNLKVNNLKVGQSFEIDYMLGNMEITVPGKYKVATTFKVLDQKSVNTNTMEIEFELK